MEEISELRLLLKKIRDTVPVVDKRRSDAKREQNYLDYNDYNMSDGAVDYTQHDQLSVSSQRRELSHSKITCHVLIPI